MGKQLEEALFSGQYSHSLDQKGRVQFPASFRSILQQSSSEKIILTNFICDGARCLEGYLSEEWDAFTKKLRDRGRFDPKVRKLENYYISRAVECSLDGSGRILLPQPLREYAGLMKEVVFTASLHGFRLWDARVWELIFQESESALLENPALFAEVDV